MDMDIAAWQIPDPSTRNDITIRTKTGLSVLIYMDSWFIWPYIYCVLERTRRFMTKTPILMAHLVIWLNMYIMEDLKRLNNY